MTTNTIRENLQSFIAEADDNKIEELYKLLENELNQSETSFILTEEHIEILDEERQKHLKGESKSYTWEEAKEIIRTNKVDA